jgi:arylsulfatase A-like enzyme
VRFTDEATPPPYPTAEQIEAHQEWDAWKSAREKGVEDRSDLAEVIGHYDAEIHYADRQIGRVIDALVAEGAYDDVWIVTTPDHGEEVGEHGLYVEHWSTHDGTQRVPMVIKPPADVDFDPGTPSS